MDTKNIDISLKISLQSNSVKILFETSMRYKYILNQKTKTAINIILITKFLISFFILKDIVEICAVKKKISAEILFL